MVSSVRGICNEKNNLHSTLRLKSLTIDSSLTQLEFQAGRKAVGQFERGPSSIPICGATPWQPIIPPCAAALCGSLSIAQTVSKPGLVDAARAGEQAGPVSRLHGPTFSSTVGVARQPAIDMHLSRIPQLRTSPIVNRLRRPGACAAPAL